MLQNQPMVHDAAAQGFDRDPSTYQRARPSYHPDLVARFVERYGAGAVLELGAGMRQRLLDALPTVDVREGKAESLPVESASCDTIVAAQSFHWFDWKPALNEIHRVLRHGGHLVTVWNVKNGDTDWFKAYMEILDRHAGDTPRHADMRWRAAIDGDRRYELVDDWHVDHPTRMNRDGVVARALSTSFIAALPDDDRERVATELRRVLGSVAEPLHFPYRAELQAWRTDH